MVARRQWTRAWWAASQGRARFVTSPAVIDELERGSFPGREDGLQLLGMLPLLAIQPAIQEIVEA